MILSCGHCFLVLGGTKCRSYVSCDAGSTPVISHSSSRDIVSACAVFPLAVAVS